MESVISFINVFSFGVVRVDFKCIKSSGQLPLKVVKCIWKVYMYYKYMTALSWWVAFFVKLKY